MTVRVLVVDDSAVVRLALSRILGRAGLSVETAHDPIIALRKMERDRPDVLVLDIELPRMDGLTFLATLMERDPIPVVICSSLAGPDTSVALEALERGAVDVVARPRLGVQGFLEDSARRLVDVVRAAAQARVRPRPRVRRTRRVAAPPTPPAPPARPAQGGAPAVVVIGASTGGTEALREILEALPAEAPAIAVVQHMPEVFTAQFARRLDQLCRIEVKEAEHGDALRPGRALIAPGNRHLLLHRVAAGYGVALDDGPPVSRHRPSVDVLFRSAAQVAGADAVGVLLTGMGQDGAEGLLALRRSGARTVAQDEPTSVVFGMPREAIVRGAAEEVLPLPDIAGAILRLTARVGGGQSTRPWVHND